MLVDHPEPAANPAIQKVLDSLGKRPVRFLSNTHWHYDHVGSNEIYGPEAIIVARENVRMRLMAKQTPYWSPKPIDPYPEALGRVLRFATWSPFTLRAKILRWIITRTLIRTAIQSSTLRVQMWLRLATFSWVGRARCPKLILRDSSVLSLCRARRDQRRHGHYHRAQ